MAQPLQPSVTRPEEMARDAQHQLAQNHQPVSSQQNGAVSLSPLHPPPQAPDSTQTGSSTASIADYTSSPSQQYAPPPSSLPASSDAFVLPTQTPVNGAPISTQHTQQGPPPMYLNGHGQPSGPPRYVANGSDSMKGPSNGHHRMIFPLPLQNIADLRPPKKEIKRRTKSGCRTCRKRRIKCDEGHPSCRNCMKSKRECLGYDPMFKLHGIGPSMQSVQIHSAPVMYQHAQPAATPVLSAYQEPAQHHVSPPAAVSELDVMPSREQDPSLDPALDTSALKSSGPPVAGPHTTQAVVSDPHSSGLRPYRAWTSFRVSDLFDPHDLTSTTQQPSEQEVAEIKSLLRQHAPALNTFFETSWFTDHGEDHLFLRTYDIPFYTYASRIYKSRLDTVVSTTEPFLSVESELLWYFATLPRVAWETQQSADTQLADLLHRLDVIEHLVTGAILPVNLIPPAPYLPRNPPPSGVPTPEYLTHSFWHHLGTFAAQEDSSPYFTPGSRVNQSISDSIGAMRQILSVLENRDVLYSMAIARHIGGRLLMLDPAAPPLGTTDDPEEPQNKFGVAWKFLGDEEVGGTTAVVRVMAGLGRKGVLKGRVEGETAQSQRGSEPLHDKDQKEVKVEAQ